MTKYSDGLTNVCSCTRSSHPAADCYLFSELRTVLSLSLSYASTELRLTLPRKKQGKCRQKNNQMDWNQLQMAAFNIRLTISMFYVGSRREFVTNVSNIVPVANIHFPREIAKSNGKYVFGHQLADDVRKHVFSQFGGGDCFNWRDLALKLPEDVECVLT